MALAGVSVEVLKNVVLNWILPVVAALAVYALVQGMRAPEVHTDAQGNAPRFTLMSTEGEPVALEDLRGKQVILNFWATWCGPCKVEIPYINTFARENPEVVVLGVAVDSGTLPVLKRASAELGIEYPVIRGNAGVQRQYGVRSVPTTFLIDADGTIAESHVGVVTARKLARWLR